MKQHTKIYLDYFSYTTADFIPCEICGNRAVDIHHIEARGIGGSILKTYKLYVESAILTMGIKQNLRIS